MGFQTNVAMEIESLSSKWNQITAKKIFEFQAFSMWFLYYSILTISKTNVYLNAEKYILRFQMVNIQSERIFYEQLTRMRVNGE